MGKSMSTAKQINRTPIASAAKESIAQQKPNQQTVRKGKNQFKSEFSFVENVLILMFKICSATHTN